MIDVEGGERSMNATASEGVFVVGCPRSGSTVLQGLLAAHSQLASLPESHFFEMCLPFMVPASRWARTLGLATSKAPELYRFFLESVQMPDDPTAGRRRLRYSSYVRDYASVMRRAAAAQGKPIWMDKTPNHVLWLDSIEAYFPTAKIIHILRAGVDAAASLYDVAQRHPQRWEGVRTVEGATAHWNRCLAATRSRMGRANHHLVVYERLVDDPAGVLERACRFLGVAFEPGMVEGYAQGVGELVRPDEPWKAQAGAGVVKTESKFGKVFTPAQQQYVLEHLDDASDVLAHAESEDG